MKILEMIATLSPGGAEGLVADLSRNFAERGSQVKLFLLAGVRGSRGALLQEQLAECGVEIIGVADRKPATLSNLVKLVKCLKSWQPDVVHCHLYSSEFAYAFASTFLTRRKPIAARTLHNTDILESHNSFIVKYLHKAFDLTIACSNTVCTSYRMFMGQNKIVNVFSISNGCTLANSVTDDTQRKAARTLLRLPLDKIIFLNIAGFRGNALSSSQKAHDILLKAFAAVSKGHEDAILVLAGDGPLRPEAEILSKSLGIQDKVSFLGNVSEPWPVLQAADIFAMPSRHEGLPLALLEASSTGLPVVASDIPEITKISPGHSWKVFRVNDVNDLSEAMREMTSNLEKYRSAAVIDATHITAEYSINKCADNYCKLFVDAITNGNKSKLA